MERFQPFSITLEILPEDEHDPDPAAVSTFASDTIQVLRRQGYESQPLPTGQRGGIALVFQIVNQGIQALGPALLAQKDTIDVISSLCTILTAVKDLLLTLLHPSHQPPSQEHTITVRITIDGAELEIASPDLADDERLVQLATQLYTLFPQVQPGPQSKVQVQALVPRQQARPRR